MVAETERSYHFEHIIKEQNQLLKDRNKNFIDSLNYSERIQSALLPGKDRLSYFSDSFIIYKPKDIVSGDFYWFKETADNVFFASIDCTGHGVPGALMTVLANALLNELIIHEKKTAVSQILNELDLRLKEALNTFESYINDGFDIALCCIDKKSNKMCFSGAFHNVFIVKIYSVFCRIFFYGCTVAPIALFLWVQQIFTLIIEKTPQKKREFSPSLRTLNEIPHYIVCIFNMFESFKT